MRRSTETGTSDVLPTAWQAVDYASVPPGGSVAVLGLGPIGDMSCRIAARRGADTVIGVDLVPERLDRARQRGFHALDLRACGDGLTDAVRELTGGRGPDAVIDAVGMEAHGSWVAAAAQQMTTFLDSRWRGAPGGHRPPNHESVAKATVTTLLGQRRATP